MAESFPDTLLLVGKVIRPHGLDGLLRITSYAESTETFTNPGVVYLKRVSGERVIYHVTSMKPHKAAFLLGLEGLKTIEEAELNRGAEIYIAKESLRREEGEYFWHELIGMKVYCLNGEYVGTITQVLPTGSNDILIVREGEKELLIPATDEVVREIDLENHRMIILEMEGLFDLNEA